MYNVQGGPKKTVPLMNSPFRYSHGSEILSASKLGYLVEGKQIIARLVYYSVRNRSMKSEM
jgi:hypothetical protein